MAPAEKPVGVDCYRGDSGCLQNQFVLCQDLGEEPPGVLPGKTAGGAEVA